MAKLLKMKIHCNHPDYLVVSFLLYHEMTMETRKKSGMMQCHTCNKKLKVNTMGFFLSETSPTKKNDYKIKGKEFCNKECYQIYKLKE